MNDYNINTGLIDNEKDEVKITLHYYETYKSSSYQWRQRAIENDKFRHGEQWTEEEKKALLAKGQFPIVVNVIEATVEQAKGMLTANKPRFQGAAREDSDTRMAKIYADLMSWIWDISQGNAELKQVVDDYYVKGMGVIMVYPDFSADFGKGEIYIKSLDPLKVYIDPNSRDIFCRDATHILVTDILSREQVQKQFPLLNIDELEESYGDETEYRPYDTVDTTTRKYLAIDRYSLVKVKYFHTLDTLTLQEKIMNEEEFAQYVQTPCYVIEQENDVTWITDTNKYPEVEKRITELGNVYHMENPPPQQNPETGELMPALDENGQPIPPQPVPGYEQDAINNYVNMFVNQGLEPELAMQQAQTIVVPNSTVIIQRLSYKDAIENEIILTNITSENRIKRVLVIGNKLVYSGIMSNNVDRHYIIPFMNRFRRNPYPMSDVDFVKDLQLYINKIRSLIMAHAASSTNVKLLIPEGAVDKKVLEREWGKAGTAVIPFNAEVGQPIVAGPIALPNELYADEDRARNDIREILGIYPFQQGDVSNAPNTYKGTIALDEFGQRRIKSKQDDIEFALNEVCKVVVQLIPTVYNYHKIIRIINPNNIERAIEINKPIYNEFTKEIIKIVNDVSVGKYDVVCISGSTLPSNRWARAEYYTELYAKGIIDRVEVLKQTEVADIEGVLERTDEIANLQMQIQQLQQQIKEISGDLQTARREAIHANQKVEVEKFKTELKRMLDQGMQTVTKKQQELENIVYDNKRTFDMERKLLLEKEKNRIINNKKRGRK